ncbi:MAG: hypothetical protein HQL69_08460 [Magnetococcales bacterium]|nr:hypothetical protein [Magnetococcales bacterium]
MSDNSHNNIDLAKNTNHIFNKPLLSVIKILVKNILIQLNVFIRRLLGRYRVLLVHTKPLSAVGGAEISLAYHVANLPYGVKVDVIQPQQEVDLSQYQVVIIANIRPDGGVGEEGEYANANLWSQRLEDYQGWSIKSEHDLHPCGHRNASCIEVDPLRRIPCGCSHMIPNAFEKLYNSCTSVRFLSPGHQQVVNKLINITSKQFVVGSPIDFTKYRSWTPYKERKAEALIIGDALRVDHTVEQRAIEQGFKPVKVPHLSIQPEDMPAIYNQYQAVVISPVTYHPFCRMAVEAIACGCKVIHSNRVGAFTFGDPVQASRKSNTLFWKMVLRQGLR